MKIKQDFVTNSSSTSYVIIAPKEDAKLLKEIMRIVEGAKNGYYETEVNSYVIGNEIDSDIFDRYSDGFELEYNGKSYDSLVKIIEDHLNMLWFDIDYCDDTGTIDDIKLKLKNTKAVICYEG